jgi:multiple sugar transport system permease protein
LIGLKINGRLIISIFVFIFGLIWLVPLAVVIINGLKTNADYYKSSLWKLPNEIGVIENIRYAWVEGALGSGFVNSMIYGIVGSTLAIFFAALAAYSLTNLKVRGRMFWFLFIYSGTVFPFQMYLIPLFNMYSDLNLYDTRLGLTIFYTAICIPFCLFVFRNYFSTIGKEISEAAKIDGCSDLRIFIQMYLPLSIAPITVLYLFQFTFIWNDLLFGLTLSRSESVKPIMAGVASLQGIYSAGNMPAILMSVLIASIPTLFLFVALQKYFMQGLTLVKK